MQPQLRARSKGSASRVVRSRLQDRFGGFVTRNHGAFHESLPVGDVFTSEQHPAKSLLQGGHHGEPLARAVESVCSPRKTICLPRFLLDSKGCTQAFLFIPPQAVGVGHVLHNPVLEFVLRRRSYIVRLVTHGVAAEYAFCAPLLVSAVEAEIGG